MKYRLKKDLPWAEAGTVWIKQECDADAQEKRSVIILRLSPEIIEIFPIKTLPNWFEEVDERWKPSRGDTYFFITSGGDVWVGTVGEKTNEGFEDDCYEMGNLFRTREQAQRAAEQIKALLKEFHKNNP